MSFEASSDSFPRRSDALNTDLSYFLDLLISIFEPSGVFHETCVTFPSPWPVIFILPEQMYAAGIFAHQWHVLFPQVHPNLSTMNCLAAGDIDPGK